MKKLLLPILISLLLNPLYSQDKADQVPLETALTTLKNHFEVRFSYPSNLVKNQEINFILNSESLLGNLNAIEEQTSIRFHKIGIKNYVLKPKKKHNQFNICGYILDNNDQLPVLEIIVLTSNKKKVLNTKENGYFEIFDLNKNSTITLKARDYKAITVNTARFQSGKCETIYLTKKIIALDEVLIKNYLTTGFSKNRDGSINVNPKKSQILPGLIAPDVLQSAQLIPGIQSPDETATGLNIRGGTPDQNLIMYDGIKMYHYDHFFGMLSAFNTNIIKDVSIYKNSSPTKYRSHISGIIDITSENKIPNKIESGLGINMIFADAFTKIPVTEKLGVIISARRSFADILETVAFDAYSDHVFQNTKITDLDNTFSDVLSKTNNTYYFQDFTAKVISKISDKKTLTLSSIYSKNKLDFQSQFDEIDQTTRDRLEMKNSGISLSYNTQWTSNLSSKLSASQSSYNFNYLGEELLDAFFKYETIKQNKIKDVNLSVSSDYKINKSNRISVGYDFISNNIYYTIGNQSDVIFDEDFLLESQNTKNITHAVFNQYQFKNKTLTVNTGLRTSFFSSLKKAYIQPKVSFQAHLSEALSVMLSAEKKNQFVSQIVEFETQNFGLENQVWAISNNDKIPVLKDKTANLAMSYNKNRLHMEVEAYLRRSEGITALTKGFNREIEGFSTGKSNTKGIELLIKKEISNFSTLVSYSLSQNKFEFQNLNSNNEFNGNFDIRHSLNIIQNIKLGNFECSAGWRFRTSTPYTPANGLIGENADNIQIDYGAINSARLGNYSRMDLSATYTLKPFKNIPVKGKIGFSLLNVLNQNNTIGRSHRIALDFNDLTYKLREINKSSISRTPNLFIRLEF